MSKGKADIAFEKLFFSKTYDFLETFLPKQACRSRHTVKQYKTGLSSFSGKDKPRPSKVKATAMQVSGPG